MNVPVTTSFAHWYRVYFHNPGAFDEEFKDLCAKSFDMDAVGAQKHHEMLSKHCPFGYQFVDVIYKKLIPQYASMREYKILMGVDCYNGEGKLLPDHVYLFRFVKVPIIPTGYTKPLNVPRDIELRVCWGNLAGDIDFGVAKFDGTTWWRKTGNYFTTFESVQAPSGVILK